MKKIIGILFLLLWCVMSQAQTTNTKLDSMRAAMQLKRKADSIKNALKQIALKKKRDSITQARLKLLAENKKRRDSILAEKRAQRQVERERKKLYQNKVRNREKYRDSIAKASKKAAELRKKNQKYLKSKEYKKKLARQKKQKADSITKAVRKDNREKNKKEKNKKIVVTKDGYEGFNYYTYQIVREPPEKKNSFLGLQMGHSNYLGDLGGNSGTGSGSWKDVNFKENTFFYGLSYTYLRREAVGLRLSYVFGEIAGSDKNTFYENTRDPAYYRFRRNLDFKTRINEFSLMTEVYPFKFFSFKKNLHNAYFQPYTLIGVGFFNFNPQGSYFDDILDDNVWVDLAPLRTEGQGMDEFPDRKMYKQTQLNIPYGFGLKYEISPSMSLGLEYTGRILFTDYLDDVSTRYINPNLFDNYLNEFDAINARLVHNKSQIIDASKAYKPGQQRGNPNNNDFYFSISARLIIKLNRNKAPKYKKQEIYKFDDSEICD